MSKMRKRKVILDILVSLIYRFFIFIFFPTLPTQNKQIIKHMKSIIITLCVVLLSIQLCAKEVSKTFEKTFQKEGIEELVLSNSYGKIEVTQNDGSEIAVTAVMKVVAKTGLKADEALDLIEVEETKIDNYLNIVTKYDNNVALKKFISGTSVQVDYKVVIPKGLKLRIIASNGDTYLGDFEGNLNVDIRDGDFKATNLKGEEFNIKQNKGNFKVEDVTTMIGDFENTTLEIESGDNIRLTTNSSDGQLNSIDKLNIRSSGGNIKLGDIEELTGSSSFTKYEIQDLGNILDMDMKMGEMNIRNIQRLFSEIRIKGSFTKVGLTFMEDAGYHLEIKRNKSLKLDLPSGMKLEDKESSEKKRILNTKFVGDTKYSGKVFLDLSNGSLYIQ